MVNGEENQMGWVVVLQKDKAKRAEGGLLQNTGN